MVYCFFTRNIQHTNDDLASEVFLAQEAFHSHTFWPTSWCYSTEIRLLNTQLITVPLFLFVKNLVTIRALTAIFCCVILFVAGWWFAHVLQIRQNWLKLFCSVLLITPFSAGWWGVVQFGNYYIPHIVFSFAYVGLFLSLMEKETKSKNATFLVLAFFTGLSSIRYLLIFAFPLAVLAVYRTVKETYNQKCWNVWDAIGNNASSRKATLGFVIGGFGYLCNSLVLKRLYSFSEWNTVAFNQIGDITFTRLHNDLFTLMGYRNRVSVLSPLGLSNVLFYVMVVFLVICLIATLKHKHVSALQRFYLEFTLTCTLITTFFYVNVDYISRYFIMTLVFYIPVLAILIEDVSVASFRRYLLGTSAAVVLFANGFATLQYISYTDENTSQYAVTDFLMKKGYRYGYATFSHANLTWFLSNGTIEVANLDKKKIDGVQVLSKDYRLAHWLTSKRFDNPDYHAGEECFLLVDEAQYQVCKFDSVFAGGKEVYDDGDYRVFEFISPEAFRSSFTKK